MNGGEREKKKKERKESTEKKISKNNGIMGILLWDFQLKKHYSYNHAVTFHALYIETQFFF